MTNEVSVGQVGNPRLQYLHTGNITRKFVKLLLTSYIGFNELSHRKGTSMHLVNNVYHGIFPFWVDGIVQVVDSRLFEYVFSTLKRTRINNHTLPIRDKAKLFFFIWTFSSLDKLIT